MSGRRPNDWPIFGRDAEGVAWRPTPELAEASRLARFLRSTGEPTLDALQARAVADPGLVLGRRGRRHRRRLAAPADPTVLDLTRRPAVGALVERRRVRLRPGGGRAARRARPRWRGARLGGRGRRRPAPDERRARATRSTAPRDGCRAHGVGAGRPRRDPAADAGRDRRRGPRARPAAGHLHADLQRLRRAGDRDPPRRLRGVAAHHGRRLPAARVRGCRSRPSRTRRSRRRRRCGACSSCGGRATRSRRPWTAGRDAWWDDAGRGGEADARRSAARSTPRRPYMLIYTSGTTGRPEGRGPRPRRLPDQGRPGPRPPVRPRAAATPCSGSPTSAG